MNSTASAVHGIWDSTVSHIGRERGRLKMGTIANMDGMWIIGRDVNPPASTYPGLRPHVCLRGSDVRSSEIALRLIPDLPIH